MFVVALTGNYGMGKSSVASLFRKLGAYTLDSDAIVASLLRKKAVIEKIRVLLGPEVLNADHTLNKSVVADIIFQNKTARKKIETLLHPLVFQEMESEIRKIKSDSKGLNNETTSIHKIPPTIPLSKGGISDPSLAKSDRPSEKPRFGRGEGRFVQCKSYNCIVIVEVPLLFESGFHNRFDRTVAVYTNQKTALSRLKKKGISRKDALARLLAQMDIRKKKRLADYVIDNNGTKQQAMVQVRKVFQALMADEESMISKGLRRS